MSSMKVARTAGDVVQAHRKHTQQRMGQLVADPALAREGVHAAMKPYVFE
jgi:hypothetical protein